MTTEKCRYQVLSILKALVAFGEFDWIQKVLEYKSSDKYDKIGHTLFFPEQMEDLKNNVVNEMPEIMANYLKSATYFKYDDLRG